MRKKIDFKDDKIFADLELKAYYGTIEVTGFPPAEYVYFSELTKLYHAFRFNGLSKDTAENKKRSLLKEYHDNLDEQKRTLKLYKKYQEHIRIAEMNLSKIEKSHDVTEIALLACEIIGYMMGEDTFYSRQKTKILEDK